MNSCCAASASARRVIQEEPHLQSKHIHRSCASPSPSQASEPSLRSLATVVSPAESQRPTDSSSIIIMATATHQRCPANTRSFCLPQTTPMSHLSPPNSNRTTQLFHQYVSKAQQQQQNGNKADALVWFGRALRIKQASLVSEPPSIQFAFADVLVSIAMIQLQSKNSQPAVQALMFCLEIRKALLGPAHMLVAQALRFLGSSYGAIQEHETAIYVLSEALAVLFQLEEQQQDNELHDKCKAPEQVNGTTAADEVNQEISDVWTALAKQHESLGHDEDAATCRREAGLRDCATPISRNHS